MNAIMSAVEAMSYLTVREAQQMQSNLDDGDWDFWSLTSIVMDESLCANEEEE